MKPWNPSGTPAAQRDRLRENLDALEERVEELEAGRSGAGSSGGDNPDFMSKDDLEDELDAYDVDPGDLEGTLQDGSVGQRDMAAAVKAAREMEEAPNATPHPESIVSQQRAWAQSYLEEQDSES